MVYGVLVLPVAYHAVAATRKTAPMYFSAFFTPEGNDEHIVERRHYIAASVARAAAAESDAVQGSAQSEGAFALRQSRGLVPDGCVAVWLAAHATCITLVVGPNENRALAKMALHTFVSALGARFKSLRVMHYPNELLERAEEVHRLSEEIFPGGLLVHKHTSAVQTQFWTGV